MPVTNAVQAAPGCMGDKSRRGILKTLQFNAFHDHSLYKQFGGFRRKELPYLSDIMQVTVD